MAYYLEETATAVSNIVESPDVIIFYSLSNDVKTKTNEEVFKNSLRLLRMWNKDLKIQK